jgi:hypothetical protein
MSSMLKHWRMLTVAVCCAGVGAGISAITSAGAAPATSSKPGKSSPAAGGHGRRGGLRGLARRAVHGDVIVHTPTGFATATFDRGVVDSVSGQQLKLTEGTPKATYKTVTLTIPSTARVRDNRHKATLADVKAGQRVIVAQLPMRTLVVARTPKRAHS